VNVFKEVFNDSHDKYLRIKAAYNVGFCYFHQKKYLKTKEWYSKALSIDKNYNPAIEGLKKVGKLLGVCRRYV